LNREIINTDLNQDVVISVNVGGSQTEALRVSGSSGQVYIPTLEVEDILLGDATVSTGSFSTLTATSSTLGSFLATSGSAASFYATNASASSLLATTGSFSSATVANATITTANVTTSNVATSNITTANITTANISLINPTVTSSGVSLTLTAASPDLVVMTGGTIVKLPGDVLLGRTFEIINTTASAITVQTSSNATLALVLAGKVLYVTAVQNNPTAITHWLAQAASKQIEKGTAVVAAVTRASTAYGAFSTNVGLTFTAAMPGKYKIYTQASVDLSVTTSTYGLKVVATAGSPTDYWSPQNASAGTLITGTSRQQTLVQKIDTLVAGTSYTYALYGASTSGTLTLKGDLAEIVLIAEFIE